jgi:hypothetical protein
LCKAQGPDEGISNSATHLCAWTMRSSRALRNISDTASDWCDGGEHGVAKGRQGRLMSLPRGVGQAGHVALRDKNDHTTPYSPIAHTLPAHHGVQNKAAAAHNHAVVLQQRCTQAHGAYYRVALLLQRSTLSNHLLLAQHSQQRASTYMCLHQGSYFLLFVLDQLVQRCGMHERGSVHQQRTTTCIDTNLAKPARRRSRTPSL